MDDNKEKALAAALGQIERQFGKGSMSVKISKLSPPGRLASILHSVLVACPVVEWLKSMDRNLPVKLP
jgi:hypothetical protein